MLNAGGVLSPDRIGRDKAVVDSMDTQFEPVVTQGQDTTLIFVELSDWVASKLKGICLMLVCLYIFFCVWIPLIISQLVGSP